jgi:hypothetical protein
MFPTRRLVSGEDDRVGSDRVYKNKCVENKVKDESSGSVFIAIQVDLEEL